MANPRPAPLELDESIQQRVKARFKEIHEEILGSPDAMIEQRLVRKLKDEQLPMYFSQGATVYRAPSQFYLPTRFNEKGSLRMTTNPNPSIFYQAAMVNKNGSLVFADGSGPCHTYQEAEAQALALQRHEPLPLVVGKVTIELAVDSLPKRKKRKAA